MKRRVGLCCAGAWLGASLAVGCGSSPSSPSGSVPGTGTNPTATGAAAMPMAAAAGAGATTAATGAAANPTVPQPAGAAAMGECGLDTGYDGDEYCLMAPPPDKGFQLHIGPSNYENPEAEYLLQPGEEDTRSFSAVSTNTAPIYFYYRQFRMRPGAHHNIITTRADEEERFGMGSRIGTSNHLSEDSPKDGLIAPENEGVGIALGPNSPISVSLHSINTSDRPQLREVWVNFWYRDPQLVKEPVEQLFAVGDPTFQIQPGEDTILGPYRCDTTGQGRMLWFYGHRHANNVRFSAWRVRGDKRDLFYESFDWEEPLVLEFSSTVRNATPDRERQIEGGWSGVLDIEPGDQIEWECHIVNKTDSVLGFSNETYTGEMCIMDAELVGANCRQGGGGPPGGSGAQGGGPQARP